MTNDQMMSQTPLYTRYGEPTAQWAAHIEMAQLTNSGLYDCQNGMTAYGSGLVAMCEEALAIVGPESSENAYNITMGILEEEEELNRELQIAEAWACSI